MDTHNISSESDEEYFSANFNSQEENEFINSVQSVYLSCMETEKSILTDKVSESSADIKQKLEKLVSESCNAATSIASNEPSLIACCDNDNILIDCVEDDSIPCKSYNTATIDSNEETQTEPSTCNDNVNLNDCILLKTADVTINEQQQSESLGESSVNGSKQKSHEYSSDKKEPSTTNKEENCSVSGQEIIITDSVVPNVTGFNEYINRQYIEPGAEASPTPQDDYRLSMLLTKTRKIQRKMAKKASKEKNTEHRPPEDQPILLMLSKARAIQQKLAENARNVSATILNVNKIDQEPEENSDCSSNKSKVVNKSVKSSYSANTRISLKDDKANSPEIKCFNCNDNIKDTAENTQADIFQDTDIYRKYNFLFYFFFYVIYKKKMFYRSKS